MKRPSAAMKRPSAAPDPWDKNTKRSKSEAQFLFVPREEFPLVLAVMVFFSGPAYAMAIYLGIVTHRRISEVLRIRAQDLMLEGGEQSSQPHIWFGPNPEGPDLPGLGKLCVEM